MRGKAYRDLLETIASLADASDVEASLRSIRTFLEESSTADVIDAVCDGEEDRRAIKSIAGELEHVGFLGPPGMARESLERAARASGFDQQPFISPSRIVATELGAVAGRPVPTTILRAFSATKRFRRVGIEVFIPTFDEAMVRSWIREGLVAHLAIELRRRDADVFSDIVPIFESAGFQVASFMADVPWIISQGPNAEFRTVYFDRQFDGRRCRIELFNGTSPSMWPK